MRGTALLVALVLISPLLFADDHNVDFDIHADFSKIKTFAIRDGKIVSTRPELNNALVQSKIKDGMRAILIAKGLKETTNRPDMAVEFNVSHVDYGVGPFGVAREVSPGRGGRGRGGSDPQSTNQVDFIEGTLVIDMSAGEPATLIWRGVYRDNEKSASKFSDKLPSDAKKLLSEFPPKKK